MSIITNLQGCRFPHDLDPGIQKYPSAERSNGRLESQESATSVESTHSSVSQISCDIILNTHKRPLPPLAKCSESKSIRLDPSEPSDDCSIQEGETKWTQAQIDVLVEEIQQRKITPWEPVGFDEIARRVGGHTRQECVVMYDQLVRNERLYQSIRALFDVSNEINTMIIKNQNDPAFDLYLSTGKLYDDSVYDSLKSGDCLFLE